jgi:hypothetical protein
VTKDGRDAASVHGLVDACRACRTACETILDERAGEHPRRSDFAQTIICAATFSIIAVRLESGEAIPAGLIASAIELARTTSEGNLAARGACNDASEELRHFLECGSGDQIVV